MVTKFKKNKKTLIYVSIGIFVLGLTVLIPLGFSTGDNSSNVYVEGKSVNVTGVTLKDAIDDLNYYATMNCPKDNTCVSKAPKCRRATTLHTETCTNSSSSYCKAAGYASGATITYGNTTTHEGILATGDAFDCDVNGDGNYDSETERFYFVSDYYDTKTKNFIDKIAVLIYYSNVRGGVANNAGTAYDCTSQNYNGPVTARAELPTTTQWSNITLYKDSRQILAQNNATSTAGGVLPTAFDYSGYAARLLTYQEAYNGCNSYNIIPTGNGGLDAKCQFLMEGTRFSSNSLATYGPWLETPAASYSNIAFNVNAYYRNLYNNFNAYNTINGARPTIEILKSEISY